MSTSPNKHQPALRVLAVCLLLVACVGPAIYTFVYVFGLFQIDSSSTSEGVKVCLQVSVSCIGLIAGWQIVKNLVSHRSKAGE